jgi:predicted aspartyl protease
MARTASLRALLLAAATVMGSVLPGVAQTAPPKEITFQVFPRGGAFSRRSATVPPPQPIEIKPGSTLITFPDGSAAIVNPSPSLPLPANTVPFTLTASGQILLTAHVGAGILHLVLDTGASSTGLLPASAAKLKVRLDPTANTVHGVRFGTLPDVALGDIPLKNIPVVITEMAALTAWNSRHPDQRIDGVLGIDTLQQWAIGLDLLAHTVTFWKGGHVDRDQIIAFQMAGLQRYAGLPEHQELIKAPLASPIPMHHKTRDAEHPFYSVTVQLDRVEVEMDVDTGALISTIPAKIAVGLKPLVTIGAAIRTLNGDVPITTMALRAMKVGPLTVEFPMVAAQSPKMPAEFAAATLGRPFFDRCQVVLDFPAATLFAARLANESKSRVLLPALGIFPHAQEQRLTVLVQPGSAAAEIGIHQEDEIVNVEETNTLLPGSPQADPLTPTDLTLTIRRAGSATPLKFALRVLRIPESLAGQPISFPEGGRLYTPGRSGGTVIGPNSKVVPTADDLLLFNTKPTEPSPTTR